jgi:hypothetical protein
MSGLDPMNQNKSKVAGRDDDESYASALAALRVRQRL